MKHLDDRVSDLVDDRLDHDERDRVLAHLAGCEYCRDAVESERFAKGALTSLPDVDVPGPLTGKLLALAEPGGPLPPEQPADDAHVASWGQARRSAPTSAHSRTAGHHHARSSFVDRHRRGMRVAAGGMVSTGALLVALASLGAPSGARDNSAVVPPMEQFTVEHARSTGGLPFAEPASILVPTLNSADASVPQPGSLGVGSSVADIASFTGDGR